jgi:hypothetical protein
MKHKTSSERRIVIEIFINSNLIIKGEIDMIKGIKIAVFIVLGVFMVIMLSITVLGHTPPQVSWDVNGNAFGGGTTQIFGTTTNDDVAIHTNGVQRMIIYRNGDVAIGVATPTHKLHISDSSTTNNRAGLYVTQTGAPGGGNTVYGTYVTKTGAGAGTNVGGYFSASGATGNNYGLIVENGFVGIGDTTPEYLVDIYSGNGDNPFMVDSTGTVDPVVINSDGRVGIGTATPYGTSTEQKVTITAGSSGVGTPDANSVLIVENDFDVNIQLLSPDGYGQNILFGDATSVNTGKIYYNHGVDLMEFSTNSAMAVTIDSSQQVGIGTGSPDNPLELLSSTTPQFRITNTDATDYATFSVDTDGQLDITTVDGVGTGGHINLMPDGNVGIGTTSPDNLFSMYGSNPIMDIETSDSDIRFADDLGTIQFRGLDTTQTHLVGAMIRAEAQGTWDGDDEDNAPTMLQFFTEDDTTTDHLATPRMVINRDGCVGIGNSLPDGNYLLHIGDNGGSSGNIKFESSDGDEMWMGISTSDKFFIVNTNYIGFGTTDPSASLEIQNSGVDPTVLFSPGTGQKYSIGLDISDDKFKIGESTITTNTRFTIDSSGNVGIGTTGPTGKLDINGNDIRIQSSQSPSPTSAGNVGEIAWDSQYIYVCTASNYWERVAISHWT